MSFYMQVSKLTTYVINLKKDIEKKKKMQVKLADFSFKYTFFDAVYGNDFDYHFFKDYNDYLRKLFLGRSLFKSELGSYESHKKIWQMMIDKKIKIALILEDDIIFEKKFEAIVLKILDLNFDWELIRFLNTNKLKNFSTRPLVNIIDNVYVSRTPKMIAGGHAYLLTINGAKKLIDLSKNHYHHFDLVMCESWKNNLDSLVCYPGKVYQDPILGVDQTNHPRFIKPKKNFFTIYTFSRLIFKFYESFFKWSHFLSKFFLDYKLKKSLKNKF